MIKDVAAIFRLRDFKIIEDAFKRRLKPRIPGHAPHSGAGKYGAAQALRLQGFDLTMRPVVDEEKCTGCGNCELLCPAVFQLIEGKSKVIDPDACDFANCCEAAAENCPEGAITIEED